MKIGRYPPVISLCNLSDSKREISLCRMGKIILVLTSEKNNKCCVLLMRLKQGQIFDLLQRQLKMSFVYMYTSVIKQIK